MFTDDDVVRRYAARPVDWSAFRIYSLIPGLDVKLSTIILAGPMFSPR